MSVSASHGTNPTPFPDSSRPSRHRPNGLLSRNFCPWRVNLTRGSHMGEPRNGRSSRTELPIAGVGFLGRGQPAPSHQLGRSAVSSPVTQWGLGHSPRKFRFFAYLGPTECIPSYIRLLKGTKISWAIGGRAGGGPL